MTSEETPARPGQRDSMSYDLVVVGAGPAGLAAAIRARQLAEEHDQELSVVVLEKGSDSGMHILSGAVMDPRALTELIPDWKERGAPLNQPVTDDAFVFLGPQSGFRLPRLLLPPFAQNHGNFIVSLGAVTRWLALHAETLGVDIFPSFPASDVLYTADGAVRGVGAGGIGLGKDGKGTDDTWPGMEILGRYTLFAEGARGHLGRQLIARYRLDQDRDPQSFGIGIKELWEIAPERHQPGLVMHTAGWPMDDNTYGGGFLYHLQERQLAVGFITGLGYDNPYLDPFEEFQRWKTHPRIRYYFEDGNGQVTARRLCYGARAINASGINSLPKMVFPGGALVGCDAGFLNVGRIKGSHAAIKSGMLAAEAAYEAITADRSYDELKTYPEAFEKSWLHTELHKDRNFKNWFKYGLTTATLMNGLEQLVLRGHVPWTLHRDRPDHACLKPAAECRPIAYPKPDGKLTFDRLSSVFISNTNHDEDQPSHLTLKDASVPVRINLARYAGLETRYCPAGVYEFVPDESQGGQARRLQINAQNCVHCKTCDIKDPTQNIVWVTPEGGGGPNYAGM